MDDYTVLLLRPEYVSDIHDMSTWLAHVTASSVEDAERAAREEAALADHVEIGGADYHVLFVALGHHRNLI